MNFTMQDISDQQLLDELKNRFDRNQQVMKEQHELLSQLERINARLLQSEQVQSAFLSNIRNEINNPLTAIIGLSREMTGGKSDRDQLVKNAQLVFSESFVLQFQLQNIFVAAELEAGQAQPYVVKVNIKKLLESTLESFNHLLLRKNIALNFDAPELIFMTDSEKLKVIFANLLMNAIGHSAQGGEIRILIYCDEENHLVISVIDRGKGIPKNKLEKIFDRFVQLDTGTTKTHAGHGLGLSVVKSLTEFVGGVVDVKSEVGVGSVFIVRVPEMIGIENSQESSTDGNEFVFDTDDMMI
jgi:signal transduction histidine kinase